MPPVGSKCMFLPTDGRMVFTEPFIRPYQKVIVKSTTKHLVRVWFFNSPMDDLYLVSPTMLVPLETVEDELNDEAKGSLQLQESKNLPMCLHGEKV